MFCGECGTENPDMNRFCKNCGKPLKRAQPIPTAAEPVQVPAAMPPAAPPMAGTMTPPQPTKAAGAAPQRAKDFTEFKSSLMSINEFKRVSKEVPLARRPQRWWDLLSILGGIAAAVIWFIYGGLREGFDWISTLLMIAIPVILVWFRPNIDQILLSIQPYRRKIPKILLIGIGIAAPFLTAWLLYNIFFIRQYPLMWANLIVGTLVAYALTRNPQVPSPKQPGYVRKVQNVAMFIGIILLVTLVVAPVLADDCTRDPLNAQDCLRTPGYAEVMAGIVATILSGLVNGPIIIQGILQGGSGDDGDTPDDQEEDEKVSISLTHPAGFSQRVFTHGWIFGASATVGDEDVSGSVKWNGTGSFEPDTGPVSHPSFASPGPNQIILTVMTKKGAVSKKFGVDAVSPSSYAHVGSKAQCWADAHGCPACPHPVVGPINTGSHTILIGGLPAARVGDTGTHAACCGPNTFTVETGDPSVLIDGRPAARIGDTTRHCGGMGTIIG